MARELPLHGVRVLAVEHILGLRIKDGERLEVAPALPSHWPGFRAKVMIGNRRHEVEVTRDQAGTPRIRIDAEGAA